MTGRKLYEPDRRRWIGDTIVQDVVVLPALKARYFVNFPIVDEARFALADALEAFIENRHGAFYDEDRYGPSRISDKRWLAAMARNFDLPAIAEGF